MVVVAFAGYIVNYYSSLRFPTSPQIASTLGAFAVGTLANIYSRARHGVAAAILIPAIFTQVPGGLASNGGLLSGLQVSTFLLIVRAVGVAISLQEHMTRRASPPLSHEGHCQYSEQIYLLLGGHTLGDGIWA